MSQADDAEDRLAQLLVHRWQREAEEEESEIAPPPGRREPVTHRISVGLTAKDHALFEAAARREDRRISDWLRHLGRRAVQEDRQFGAIRRDL